MIFKCSSYFNSTHTVRFLEVVKIIAADNVKRGIFIQHVVGWWQVESSHYQLYT